MSGTLCNLNVEQLLAASVPLTGQCPTTGCHLPVGRHAPCEPLARPAPVTPVLEHQRKCVSDTAVEMVQLIDASMCDDKGFVLPGQVLPLEADVLDQSAVESLTRALFPCEFGLQADIKMDGCRGVYVGRTFLQSHVCYTSNGRCDV